MLKVDPKDTQEFPNALSSTGYRIYLRSNVSGQVAIPTKVVIPVKKSEAGKNNLLLWVQQGAGKTEILSCGGEVLSLNAQSAGFQGCDVHEDLAEIQCSSAFQKNFQGVTQWVMGTGKAVQKWIELKLVDKHQVLKFEFRPAENTVNNIKRIKVVFDDKSAQFFDLLKLDTLQTFAFESKQTARLRFEIEKVHHNEVETGGSFNVLGLKCKQLTEPDKLDRNQFFPVQCRETMFNHPVFANENLRRGLKFNIQCASGCLTDADLVYGTTDYEQTSALCAAATHSGVIEDAGGRFVLTLIEPNKIFKGTEQNDLKSKSKKSNHYKFRILRIV